VQNGDAVAIFHVVPTNPSPSGRAIALWCVALSAGVGAVVAAVRPGGHQAIGLRLALGAVLGAALCAVGIAVIVALIARAARRL
jgi:hypothetical protein